MTRSGPTMLKTMLLGIGLVAAATVPALAQKGLDEPFQGAFKSALEGKTVAYVPVAMNFDLTEGWFAGLKRNSNPTASRWWCAMRTGAPTPARRR